jgi:hypothetical protein
MPTRPSKPCAEADRRMTAVDRGLAKERADYGSTLLVVLGWYASLVAAMVTGIFSVPVRPVSQDCIDFCFDRHATFGVALVFLGLPAGVVLAGASVLVIAATTRLSRSPIVAGTLAVGPCIALVVAGFVILTGVR